ncbi:MAG: UDP-3-O-(3-hydroxymyristoyl)glucosamine N-acyltransferase [Pseudobdellovibrionaceae bacterium]
MIAAQVISNLKPDSLVHMGGDLTSTATYVRIPIEADSESLVFASKEEDLKEAVKNDAAILVVTTDLAKSPLIKNFKGALYSTPRIQKALSQILPLFDYKRARFLQNPTIHQSACVHETAKIGEKCTIGPNAVIGEHAVVGDRSVIGAGTIVEKGAHVGSDCILHPLVFVGADCWIGNHCEIHPHTTIGADGFGYFSDASGHHKIPQVGKVILEDHVEIGANCAVDRATISETRIGAMTKLDNFVHIAHNCKIGKGCLITAGFIVAGSTEIGDFFVCGGSVRVTDHLKIAEKVQLAGVSVVTKDISESGSYGGHPLQPIQSYLRTQSSFSAIPEMRKDISKIKKQLGITEEN